MTEVEIENGLYEIIRLKLVSLGYLPDVTNYLPNNISGWETKVQEIKDAGNKLIFVENSGSYRGRENLEENCIVIDQEDSAPSQTGTKSISEYTYNESTEDYTKETTTNGLFDLQYRISIVCYDASYLAIMQDVIRQTLGFRKKIESIDNDTNVTGSFWCWRGNYLRLDGSKFMERAMLFNIPSVDLIGNSEGVTVARAEQITLNIDVQDYNVGDESIVNDSIDIVIE